MAVTTDLSGRVAIVTGSATGLGASIAKRLAEAGSTVIINYSRSSKEAEATADECRAFGVGDLLDCFGNFLGRKGHCVRRQGEPIKPFGIPLPHQLRVDLMP